MRLAVLILWFGSFLSVSVSAATHYVDLNCTNPVPPYTNWVTAATNIQDAVNAASDGDDVQVTNGTYLLSAQVVITNAITIQSANGSASTIIDGQDATRCFNLSASGAVVSGFTITRGRGWEGGGAAVGGGAVLEWCIVTSNLAEFHGGGIRASGGTIRHCSIVDNTATGFGYEGGGVYSEGAATIENCLIARNHGVQGGGVSCRLGTVLWNCTIVGNEATYGGGIYSRQSYYDPEPVRVEDSIIYDNRAQCGANVCNLSTNVIYSHCCSLPLPPGSGHTDVAPDFADAPAGDYRLRPGSPCIDAGRNQEWMLLDVDLDGAKRIHGGVVDIGAYEAHPGALSADIVAIPPEGFAPLEVFLTARVSGTNTAGLVHAWDLDADGSNDFSGPNLTVVTNNYPECGQYSVALTVSNAVGEVASVVRTNYIKVGPATAFVSPSGSHAFPFTNWVVAATDIQAAVSASVDGTLVCVTDGTYRVSAEIVIQSGVTVSSVNLASSAIIDGGGNSPCIRLSHAGAVLDGFTVAGGNGFCGGGVCIDSAGLVRNCRVVSNSASVGGGVCLVNGGVMQATSVEGNTALGAGGVACWGGGVLEQCVIRGNSNTEATSAGGGIVFMGGGAARSCVIVSNVGAGVGGGVYFHQVAGLLENTVICGNRAGEDGGGVFLSEGSGRAQNCTISDNSAVGSGGGIRAWGGTIRNCIVWSNTAATGSNHLDTSSGLCTWSHVDTEPAVPGDGNIATNPLFADAAAGNYHLLLGSLCIDAGLAEAAPEEDYDGVPRPLDGNADGTNAFDMGAYEFVHPTADSDGDGLRDTNELPRGTSPVLADTDSDYMNDGAEVFAGTDPLNPLSLFELLGVAVTNEDKAMVIWTSATGKQYTVSYSSNALYSFSAIVSNVAATAPENAYTDTVGGVSFRLYRVGVQP